MSVSLSDAGAILRLLLDILAIWALIYTGFSVVRNNTRTIQLVKGIVIVVIVKGIAVVLGLKALSNLIDVFLNWGVVAVLVVFQPEIRRMLEKVGKTSPLFGSNVSENEMSNMIDQLVTACTEMSETKTGALISIQQKQSLEDYIETGVPMDSDVSSEILGTIFQYGTPLHDGAVIIQGVKIACAAAYFPPTNKDLPSKYGARHRAAVGISEITDSITIVVSEETGHISVAMKGQLTRYHPDTLRRFLMNKLIITTEEKKSPAFFEPMARTARNLGLNMNVHLSSGGSGLSGKTDERIKPLEVVDLLGERKKNG